MLLFICCVLLLSTTTTVVEAVPWLTQNFYSAASCRPADLVSVTAWRTDLCQPDGLGKYEKRGCSGGLVTRVKCDDDKCTVNCVPVGTQTFPIDQCGSQGNPVVGSIYFGCNTATLASEPPVLDANADDVYSSFVYYNSSCANPVYQAQSFFEGKCSLKTIYTCASTSSASSTTYSDDACTTALTTSPANPVGCTQGNGASSCTLARNPTPIPVANAPTTAPLQAQCSDARSRDECSGTVAIGNAYTLPVGVSFLKCCVWCGINPNNHTQGECHEPSWSKMADCGCPAANSSSLTAMDISILGCTNALGPLRTARCQCLNRPLGIKQCPNDVGPITMTPTTVDTSTAGVLGVGLLVAILTILIIA